MITNFLLYILHGVLKVILYPITLLPNASLPASFTSTISTASSYLSSFNTFLPITTLLIIISTMLLVEGGIFTFKLINWIIKKIPFIG